MRLYTVLLAVASFLLACGETKTSSIPPGIQLQTPEGSALGQLVFGDWPINQTLSREFVVVSTTRTSLTVSGIEFDGVEDGIFAVEPAQFVVPPLGSVTVKVDFTPGAPIPYLGGELLVRSDDPENPELRVPLSGNGLESDLHVVGCVKDRCSETTVSPPETLHLGEVIGGSKIAKARITLQNQGGALLQITRIAFADPDPAIAAGWQLPPNSGATSLDRGATTVFDINFHPPADPLGPAEVTLVVETTSTLSPKVELKITAEVVPNTPPEACLYLKEIRPIGEEVIELNPGDPVPDVIEPTDVLIFEARAREGCSGDEQDGEEVTYHFELAEGPDPRKELEPVLGERSQILYRAEYVGAGFKMRLEVEDSLGARSGTDAEGVPAEVVFDVFPRADIATQIEWDSEFVDVDLHFVRGGADATDLFTAEDAFCADPLRSQNFCSGVKVDWGMVGLSTDDPQVLKDSLGEGALVETVTLDGPEREGESYAIYAHFYEDKRLARPGATNCTTQAQCGPNLVCSASKCMPPVGLDLDVFFRGDPEGGIHRFELEQPCDLLLLGIVSWPANDSGSPPSFVPATSAGQRGTPSSDGKCAL